MTPEQQAYVLRMLSQYLKGNITMQQAMDKIIVELSELLP